MARLKLAAATEATVRIRLLVCGWFVFAYMRRCLPQVRPMSVETFITRSRWPGGRRQGRPGAVSALRTFHREEERGGRGKSTGARRRRQRPNHRDDGDERERTKSREKGTKKKEACKLACAAERVCGRARRARSWRWRARACWHALPAGMSDEVFGGTQPSPVQLRASAKAAAQQPGGNG